MTLLISQSAATEHTPSIRKWTWKVLGRVLSWKLWGGDGERPSNPHPGLKLCLGIGCDSHCKPCLLFRGAEPHQGSESHAWGLGEAWRESSVFARPLQLPSVSNPGTL